MNFHSTVPTFVNILRRTKYIILEIDYFIEQKVTVTFKKSFPFFLVIIIIFYIHQQCALFNGFFSKVFIFSTMNY